MNNEIKTKKALSYLALCVVTAALVIVAFKRANNEPVRTYKEYRSSGELIHYSAIDQ